VIADPAYAELTKDMIALLDEKMAEIGDEPVHTPLLVHTV
jgi:hypothetical protein